VEIYEFDRVDLADALIAAGRRGVRVRVVEDPTVAVNAATSARLRQAGAELLIFPVQTRQIDHVKLLIVDSRTAIFGGMNWGSTSWRNHDFDIAISGPAVVHLACIFAADVVRSGGRADMAPAAADPAGLRILATYPAADIRPVVLDEISHARRQVFIEMYVMTDSEVIAALSNAARRGVATFVLFDPNQDLNQLAAARLRDAGVQARFYRTGGEKLHAKAMEVDGRVLVVGSANWTSSGFLHNHELDAAIDSSALATTALARMEADWKASGG
jgi:phosphatidylserine/phosphatidylglycerophosphate/cardiolipin synthase-like enzyme